MLLFSFTSYAVDFVVEGVDSSDIEQNIILFVKQITPPVSEFDADDYEQKVIEKVNNAVQAFGYYNAKIEIAPFDYKDKGNFTLTINVNLNQITMVSRVILQADYLTNPNYDTKHVPPKIIEVVRQVRAMQGKALSHSQYESLKGQLNTLALLYGYFDFKFLLHKLLIIPNSSNNTSDATVHWLFNLGERYRFGDVTFLEDTRGQGIALDVMPFNSGELFEQSKIGQYSIDLASTGYFDNAIARANASNAVNGAVPIEVILQPKPTDTFQFGVGFSTDTGPRISFDWRRPWVNLNGHSVGGNVYLSDPRKLISLDYRIPKANPLNDFLSYRVSFLQITENETQSDNISVEALRQWGGKEEDDWDKIAFFKVEEESFIQGSQEEEKTRLVLPGFTFNRTRKDGDIFVNWGDRQQITVQGGSKDALSDIDFFKVLLKTKWIRQFDSHRFTLRADAGAIATNDFSRVPSTQRFFAGGDQSIRGFGYNEVSEREFTEVDGELTSELVGGKFLAVASAQYAYAVSEQFRAAVFVDTGSANSEFGSDLAFGYGVGLEWLSPIGDVQVYVARGESSYENSWRLHIIIGPGL